MATLLEGSFYVMTATCLVTAVVEALWPQIGSLISGAFESPSSFDEVTDRRGFRGVIG